MPRDCVFCAIVRGEAPATFLYQDEMVVAFMDNRPVQTGYGAQQRRTELESVADQIRPAILPASAPEGSGG